MKKDFEPHMMYEPKTGKGFMAKTYKDHLEMKKKGYGHTKPKKKKSGGYSMIKRKKKY